MSHILDQLKAARQERNLKQSELGAKLGLPQSHISKIEQQLSDPRLSTVADIARVLDQELMLVPRHMAPIIKALLRGDDEHEPRFKADEDGDS